MLNKVSYLSYENEQDKENLIVRNEIGSLSKSESTGKKESETEVGVMNVMLGNH